MVTRKRYIPDRGDLIWITLDPVRGHEQRGRRPALVLSPKLYNKKAGLVFVCPITSQQKGYPFEVEVMMPGGLSVALVDQARSIDWQERRATKIGRAPSAVLVRVQEKLAALLLLTLST